MRNVEEFAKLTEGEQSLVKWQFREHGSFFMGLWDCISKADTHNLQRIAKGFPSHVDAYRKYAGEAGYWDSIIARVGRP